MRVGGRECYLLCRIDGRRGATAGGAVKELLPQTKLTYRAFETTSGKLIDVSYAFITQQPTSDQFVQWFIVKDTYTHADEYVLDERWQTKSWRVFLSDKGVDYSGMKKGNQLILEGAFNQKPRP